MTGFGMYKKLFLSVKSIAVLTAASLLLTAFHPLNLRKMPEIEPLTEGEYVPGEAIICLDPDIIDAQKTAKQSAGIFSEAPDVICEDLMDVSGAAADLKEEGNASLKGTGDGKTVLKLVKSDTLSTEELIGLYSGKNGVFFAEPNYIYRIDDNTEEPVILTSDTDAETPDFTDMQYEFRSDAGGIDVPRWNDPDNKNAEGTVVAVIDSGVDYNHEDLSGVMWDDGLKYPELVKLGGGRYGIFTSTDHYEGNNIMDPKSEDPMDWSNNGHGTHCAGIIAAQWDKKGISGAANGARIMAVKATCDDEGSFYLSDLMEGYNYVSVAKDLEVNIVAVNMSYANNVYSFASMIAVKELGEKGIVCCNAASNESLDNDISNRLGSTLLSVPEAIVVGAGDENEAVCDFSDYGVRTTHIFAPGYNIMSTVPGFIKGVINNKDYSRPSLDSKGHELYDDFSSGPEEFSYEANSGNGSKTDISEGLLKVKDITLGTDDFVTSETIRDDKPKTEDPGTVLFTLSVNSVLKTLPEGKRYNFIIKTRTLEKGVWELFCYVRKKDKGWERINKYGENITEGDYTYCVYPFEKMDSADLEALTIRPYLIGDKTTLKEIEIGEIWITDEEYNYTAYKGTSMATPAVAGEVAVLAAVKEWKNDSAAKRAARVLAGAKTVENYKDFCITGGMANVRNSLDEEKYTPVISSICAGTEGLSVKGYFFGDKENTDVEIRQDGRIWAVSKEELYIKEISHSGTDEDRILLNTPEELERNTEVMITVTDRAKEEGRQSFSRFLIPDDPEGILKEGKCYSQIRLNDQVYETLQNICFFDAGALNGDIIFSGINVSYGGDRMFALRDGSFEKICDDISFEGKWAAYNGMLINAESSSGFKLVFYDEGKKIKEIPLKSADEDGEELDEKDFIDLYNDGSDFLMFRSRFDRKFSDPESVVVETLVYSLDPDTGLFSLLGSLHQGYWTSIIETSGIVIAHEEKEGKPNTIYVSGFAEDPEKGEVFTVERFSAVKGFKPEVVYVSEDFILGEAAADEFDKSFLSGCGVKNGIYITGAHETKSEGGIEYITADNYFLDYAYPEEGFKPCEKKIYDTAVYYPVTVSGYGRVYFWGLTKDGFVLSYTEADTLPHYGDRPVKEDKAVRNADGSWNYDSAQKAALDLNMRPLQKLTIEGAELEMSLCAREAVVYSGDRKTLTASILDKDRSVIKVNGSEIKIKKVTLKNPKKACVSENSIFRETIGKENLSVYDSFKDNKKPGYYPVFDTKGLSGDTKKAVKKANKYFKKNMIPIDILPFTLTGSNVKVDKYDKNKGIVKKAGVTDENGNTAKIKYNASGKKDFTSKTEESIVTITGTNNYDGQVRYDPDSGKISPVL